MAHSLLHTVWTNYTNEVGEGLLTLKLTLISLFYGGAMRNKILLALVVGILAFTVPVFSQVATKTGSIYGKTVDDKGAPLPGVSTLWNRGDSNTVCNVRTFRRFSFCKLTTGSLFGEFFDRRIHGSTTGRSSC